MSVVGVIFSRFMRRSIVALVVAIVGVGAFTGGAAWLLQDPRPPAGASRGERLFYAYFDIIKQGGSPIGRPGMPAFGYQMTDADIEILVTYLRALSNAPAAPR